VRVAFSAPATLCHDERNIRLTQIAKLITGFFVVNNRSDRNAQNHRLAITPRTLVTLTRATIVCEVSRLKLIIEECSDLCIRIDHNITAATTVAAIGTTEGHVLFTSKGNAT
jgi:hypothetical protein